MVTSSAVVGSSAMSSFGSHASAIAIMTRWRRPPDSWCGKSSSRSLGRGRPTRDSTSRARSRAAALDAPLCSRTGSATWYPIVFVGSSEVSGSWKIIAISLPRIARISSSLRPTSSRPPSLIEPPTTEPPGGSRPMIDRPVIDFPEPDSPTMPRVSPASTRMLTLPTAWTTDLVSWIWVDRSSISRTGSIADGYLSDSWRGRAR